MEKVPPDLGEEYELLNLAGRMGEMRRGMLDWGLDGRLGTVWMDALLVLALSLKLDWSTEETLAVSSCALDSFSDFWMCKIACPFDSPAFEVALRLLPLVTCAIQRIRMLVKYNIATVRKTECRAKTGYFSIASYG